MLHYVVVRCPMCHVPCVCHVPSGLTDSQTNAAHALNPAAASMDVDSKEALGIASVQDKLIATATTLTGDRKKRVKAAVAAVASREAIAKYTQAETHPLHATSAPGINAVDVHTVKQDMVGNAYACCMCVFGCRCPFCVLLMLLRHSSTPGVDACCACPCSIFADRDWWQRLECDRVQPIHWKGEAQAAAHEHRAQRVFACSCQVMACLVTA